MKHWKISYSIRWNNTGAVEEKDMIVEAMNIIEAVENAAEDIAAGVHEPNLDVVIWNVGIMEDDVF